MRWKIGSPPLKKARLRDGGRVRECRHRLRLTVQHLAGVLSNDDRTANARLVRR